MLRNCSLSLNVSLSFPVQGLGICIFAIKSKSADENKLTLRYTTEGLYPTVYLNEC